jgi:enoyl ACP reductase
LTLLDGKRLVVTGVMTRDSIAWAVAAEAQQAGAEVVLTGFGRARRLTERAARQLPVACDVLELDVNSESDLAALPGSLGPRPVDGVLHAIAYAPEDAIGGRFLDTPASSALTAFETSAFSFKALTSYDWMGVSKAALESVSRYLARSLGPRGIRVNLVAAGPLRTAAASGIDGFASLASGWPDAAPLGWDVDDAGPVARAVCFLLSDWADGITGEILHVDGGAHAVAGPVTAGGR